MLKFLLLRAGKYEKSKNSIFYSPTSHPPLGLLYIAASLEKDGHKVEIIDFYLDIYSEEKMKKSLKSVDAVGISVYTQNYKDAAYISKKIKEINSNIPIIIGGPHCIYLRKKALNDIPFADIVVTCEGEHVIKDIAKYLEGKKDLSTIPGIYYKEHNKIKQGKPLEVIEDLDTISFPARHLTEKYEYGKFPNISILKNKVTAMITGRGCPYKCRFCARYSNLIKEWGYRKRSAENIFKELQDIEGKYRTVMIVDDNFLVDTKRAHKVLDMILDNRLDFEFF